jgi:hypothetical protein
VIVISLIKRKEKDVCGDHIGSYLRKKGKKNKTKLIWGETNNDYERREKKRKET